MAIPAEVSELLHAWAGGDRAVLNALVPTVYEELTRIARARLRGERANHTLNTLGLVHEAYERLAALKQVDWQGSAHFYATATQIMRHILVDHARARDAGKRGRRRVHIPIDDDLPISDDTATLILELEDALTRLRGINERWEKVVSYRFFGGLTIEETARELGVSVPTANRDWHLARAWLNRAMKDVPPIAEDHALDGAG